MNLSGHSKYLFIQELVKMHVLALKVRDYI